MPSKYKTIKKASCIYIQIWGFFNIFTAIEIAKSRIPKVSKVGKMVFRKDFYKNYWFSQLKTISYIERILIDLNY
jgi:hypothetical protein